MSDFAFVFRSDSPNGLLSRAADLPGAPVKAQLGVRRGKSGWIDLYADGSGLAHQSRIEVFERLATLSRQLGREGFWDLFRLEGGEYGRYLMSAVWSPMERAVLYRKLLSRFADQHQPKKLFSYGLQGAHPVDGRAFREFLRHRGLACDDLPCVEPAQPSRENPWSSATACYALHGQLGQEQFVYRFGQAGRLGEGPLDPASGLLGFDSASQTCWFAGGPGGVYGEWRFRYLDLPRNQIVVSAASGGRAVAVLIDRSGIHPWTPQSTSGRTLARAGPDSAGYSLWIHRGKGGFAAEGAPATELQAVTTDLPDGLHFQLLGEGGGLCCLSRLILLNELDEPALSLRRAGFACFVKKRPWWASWFAGKQAPRVRAASLFFPGAASIAVGPDGDAELAPAYHEGWADCLAREGIGIDWVLATDPWRLDGGELRRDQERYLYGPVEEDLAALQASAKSRLEEAFVGLREKRELVLSALADPLLADLFYDGIRASLATVAALVGDQKRLACRLKEMRPDALVSPRLDTEYQWAGVAARAESLPTVSLEISFIYHEIKRLHRYAGVPEETDRICVWGEAHRQRLDELGLAGDRIQATGLLALDYYRRCPSKFDMSESALKNYRRSLGLTLQSGPLILYGGYYGAAQPLYDVDEFRRIIAACFCAMAGRSGGNVLLKSLPFDDPAVVRAVLDGFDQSRIHILPPDQPFQNAHYYAAADAVVALPTTLLAEAAAQGCPCVAAWTGTHPNWYPVSPHQIDLLRRIMPVARDDESLVAHLEEALSMRRRASNSDLAMRTLFGSVEASNARRLAEVIADGLAQRRRDVGRTSSPTATRG